MIQLRPYQVKFSNDIAEALVKYRHVIACSATGSGKSKTFISIADRAIKKNKTVLIISESAKIYTQIHEEIGVTINIGDGVKEFYVQPNKVYVAMCQTLAKRPGLIKQFAALGNELLIIVDEGHIGTFTKTLLQLQDAFQIAFTATPNYKDAKHLPLLYKGIVVGPQPQELIENNFLTPYFHYERQIAKLSGLKKSSTGEYTEASQEFVFEKKEVFEGLLDDLLKFKFRKCMVFCASIHCCSDVTEKLRKIGYDVSEVHSKNPKSDWELFQFTNGSNNVCVSVGSLTKGFDCVEIDLIFLNRATTSLSLYNQMCGRGSRLALGKNKWNVIDYGGNGTRFGFWTYTHDWAELWNKTPKKVGAAPIKCCPKCGFMMAPSLPTCPECGYEFQPKDKSIEEKKQTELIELTAKFNEIRGKKISTLTPPDLFIYMNSTGQKAFAKRVARSKGEGYLQEYARLCKWNYGWWEHIIADTEIIYNDILIR